MNVANPFTMVVMIVAIVYGAKIWRTHMMTRHSMRPSMDETRIVAEMQAQIDRLTDRVAVLEKLVTDDDRKLASEIERLRRGDGRPESRL